MLCLGATLAVWAEVAVATTGLMGLTGVVLVRTGVTVCGAVVG